jgi:hypothetical protein
MDRDRAKSSEWLKMCAVPQKRTNAGAAGISAECLKRTREFTSEQTVRKIVGTKTGSLEFL